MNLTFASVCIWVIHYMSLISLVLPESVDDRVALLAIKSQITTDPLGVLNSWNDSNPLCQWYGVTCGTKHPQRVVGLNLTSSHLLGTLSPFIGNLSFLHSIDLSSNSFGGIIPPQISHLFRLHLLVLENNTFVGQIPANLSRCLNLKLISLANNHLSGIISPQFGLLPRLETLAIHENQLMGDLLNKVIVNLSSLQTISANFNSFRGTIPNNIGQVLKNLIFLSIGENKISGTIPPSFYNLSQLHVVDLGQNQLEGILPFDIGLRLPKLITFLINDNMFQGNIPTTLSNLCNLKNLALGANNFTGKLNFSARNMPHLNFFDIGSNYLGTGEAQDLNFLQSLLNCTRLQVLQCDHNNFGGTLPSYLGNFSTNLHTIDFKGNQIFGTIPSGLFNLVNLEAIQLSENYLSGHLPPVNANLRKLNAFFCSSNNLIGNIPHSLSNLSQLSNLVLNYNNFEGSIPSSLGECKNLLHLELLGNNLSGVIPPALFHDSSMLVGLFLGHNYFSGVIPREIGLLKNLVYLNLEKNAFNGKLPTSLGGCTSLVDIEMGANSFTGSIPDSFKSLKSLNYLNLSHNTFSGQIPAFLANFSLLELDLSFNTFEGEVPSRGVFANLSAFTIEGNSKLCGGIPELHFARCPSKITPKKKSRRKGKLSVAEIVLIATASLVVGASMLSSTYFILCQRRKKESSKAQESGLNLKDKFSKVSYDMLLKATDRFSEANLLGAGRFGSVYKGVLDPENTIVVAVKVFRLEMRGATKSFMAECLALRNIRHRNLLKIVTACSSTDFQGNDFKALVYEFMPKGNLHQWIYSNQVHTTLSLLQRIDIALDVANALDYLYNNSEVPIIHCDLKPSNILLDNDFVAHVGDFGLAKVQFHDLANNSSSIAVKGTVGYAAPEYGLGSEVSKEGDIYSYGIVLIEMMTAKSPTDTMFEEGMDIHKYAQSALSSNQLLKIIDPRLLDDGSNVSINNEDEIFAIHGIKVKWIKSVIEIGVKSSVQSPQDRMRIEDVIGQLNLIRVSLMKELQRFGLTYI